MHAVDEWTTRLTGLRQEEIEKARTRIDSFGIEHLSDELTRRADIDAGAASCMVVSSIDVLIDRGVPETKLVSKLRRDKDVWPAVAEMIGAGKALDLFDSNAKVELDAGPLPDGPNADLRLSLSTAERGVSIEFKAIGLSEQEVEFFQQSSEILPKLSPDLGVRTNHIAMDNEHPIPVPTRAERRARASEERKRVEQLPARARNLTGAVIAAHYTEQRYLERVRERIETALRQLDPVDECWVALWWSNGAPILAVHQALTTIDLPAHVQGVILVGAAVAFPDPEIHYYAAMLPRGELAGQNENPSVISPDDHPLAGLIFGAFEGSSGVRPTFLVNPVGIRSKRQTLLFRDGNRPIFPFNLLIGPDPDGAREFTGSTTAERELTAGTLN
jgi:hypothetical protein